MKKLLLVGIIIIMVGMNIPSSLSKSMTIENVITVDNEGDGDYTSINEAVNNSKPGDTIEVYSGQYKEHDIHIIQANITLKGIPLELGSGNDTGKPFIDGEGESLLFIWQNASGTTLTGFNIENDGTIGAGTITLNSVKDCIISDNYLYNTHMSPIYCDNCTNISISDNTINFSHIRHGITYTECNHIFINRNVITNCRVGILNWGSDENIISNNSIYNCGDGIEVMGVDNLIYRNLLHQNENGIVLLEGFNNNFYQNNFLNNEYRDAYFRLGIYTYPFHSSWLNNYWGRPHILPKIIYGRVLYFIPWMQFDWRPALVPNDTGV